jgi:hypothetical protein
MFPKRKRKRKNKQSLDEILDVFSEELQPTEKRKDVVVRFQRDESGNRVTQTKYRNRSTSIKRASAGIK